jgi:hypothetical protein
VTLDLQTDTLRAVTWFTSIKHVTVTAILICVFVSPVRAGHASGTRYEVLGFSHVSTFLVRVVDVQHGVVAHEIRALAGGGRLLVQAFDAQSDLNAAETKLKNEHGILAPFLTGSVAPDRSAAVVVVPGPVSRTHSFSYDIRLQDGDGEHSRLQLPVPNQCAPDVGAQASLVVSWSPDGHTAVLAGAVAVEDPCGDGETRPVLELIKRGTPAHPADLNRLALGLELRIRQLEHVRLPEAALLGSQLLAVAPNRPEIRFLLARMRAAQGDQKASLALLWSIAKMQNGFSLLRRASESAWSLPLRKRASWHALSWLLDEYRLSFGPPSFINEGFVGPPWLSISVPTPAIPTPASPEEPPVP